MKQINGKIKNCLLVILKLIMAIFYLNILYINGQQLPDEATMPDGNGAWVIEQKFKNSIGGPYLPGITYVIIQSNGVVFHRKFFDVGTPATPWCQDKFTVKEMSDIRGGIAISKPAGWDASYGPFLSILGPFRALTLTMRTSQGKLVVYKTTLWRFYELPADIAKIVNAVDDAGNLAFTNCAKPEK
jgi:hypothetical protein